MYDNLLCYVALFLPVPTLMDHTCALSVNGLGHMDIVSDGHISVLGPQMI